MKKILILFIAAAVFAASCGEKEKEVTQDDEKLIKHAFDEYKKAILTKNGKKAAEIADDKTFEYWEKMRQKALSADSSETASMDPVDTFMTLLLRHLSSKNALIDIDGKEMFILAINKGWIGDSSITSLGLGAIEITNDKAEAVSTINGDPNPYNFSFIKIDGKWRFDMTSILSVTSEALENYIKTTNIPKKELMEEFVKQLNGKQPSDKIWNPLMMQ